MSLITVWRQVDTFSPVVLDVRGLDMSQGSIWFTGTGTFSVQWLATVQDFAQPFDPQPQLDGFYSPLDFGDVAQNRLVSISGAVTSDRWVNINIAVNPRNLNALVVQGVILNEFILAASAPPYTSAAGSSGTTRVIVERIAPLGSYQPNPGVSST